MGNDVGEIRHFPPGSEPAIQIRTDKGRGTFQARVPRGPVEVRSVSAREKRFLIERGVNPKLFTASRVFAVSAEISEHFDTDAKAVVDLARHVGLTQDDISRIVNAKRRLTLFKPKNLAERKAQRGLQQLFTLPVKKERGRPNTVTVDERIKIREDADTLRADGKNLNEIVRILSQRHEVRYSYAKRILEDA